MINTEIRINEVLAKWDPLGVYLIDERWPLEEYKTYVKGIIKTYYNGESIYDYLVLIFIDTFGSPNQDEKKEMEKLALEITNIIEE